MKLTSIIECKEYSRKFEQVIKKLVKLGQKVKFSGDEITNEHNQPLQVKGGHVLDFTISGKFRISFLNRKTDTMLKQSVNKPSYHHNTTFYTY